MADLLRPFRGPLTATPSEPLLRFVPAVLYMVLIFSASSIPGERIPLQFDDRVAHFLEYFVLGLLLAFGAAGIRGGTSRIGSIATLGFVALHGLADELHQGFVPGREVSVKDWVFDMLGASAALFLVRRLAAAKEDR